MAEDAEVERPDRGWFWYEQPIDPPKEPIRSIVDAPTKPAPTSTKTKPMSAAWLRKMQPILLERATDNPTHENIAALLFVQRVMLDKSQRFSEAAKQVVYSEPMLDENNRVPFSGFGKNEFMGREFLSREKALKHLAKSVGGLFVFFDSKCEYCRAQIKIINFMQETYGFNVKYISMDGKGLPGIKHWVRDNGHARLLKLKIFPTTVFVSPPNNYLIVSQGMMAKDQLGERILSAAMSKKLLPTELEIAANPWDIGVLSFDDMQNGASDNPEEFVRYIKEKLAKRY